MNPQRLYRQLHDDSLAKQIVAEEYQTFVAMPFCNQFSYRSKEVYEDVICNAVKKAGNNSVRKFARPIRVDEIAPNASEITEDIVEGILNSHFFIADFTLANHGVLLEAGIALALKATKLIVFIVQGNLSDLHFNVKDNRFICYDKKDAIEEIAQAVLSAADHFEGSVDEHIKAMRENLSPQAVYLLNLYGRLKLQHEGVSLHFGNINNDANLGDNESIRRLVFNGAVQELLSRRLLYLDYAAADDGINSDRYSLHATELGMVFIRKTWPNKLGSLV